MEWCSGCTLGFGPRGDGRPRPLYMLLSVFFCAVFAVAMSLVFVRSVLIMGVYALIISIVVSIVISLFLGSWFGIIVFLIYVGGLLVIFAYFLAICPNQIVDVKRSLVTTRVFFFMGLILMGTMAPYVLMSVIVPTQLMVLYEPVNAGILVLLGLFLLLTLVSVVKVVQLKQGPLRPFQ